MFDKFNPFQKLKMQDFSFKPIRYETWIGGQMVGSGKTNSIINAKVINQNGNEKMEITFDDKNLTSELALKNIFDLFITAGDRLQIVTIPRTTNVENMGISMFNMTIGATCETKNFNRNEPYCCNLFLINSNIAKITFSFSNPEKLIEFYLQ